MRRGWVSAWTTLVHCRSASSGLSPPCATLEPRGLSCRRDDGGMIYQGGHELDPIERSLEIGLTAGTQATSTHQVPFLPAATRDRRPKVEETLLVTIDRPPVNALELDAI